MVKKSFGSKAADIVVYLVLFLFALICLYPFWYVLSVSLTSYKAYMETPILLYPKDITFSAYEIIKEPDLSRSALLTVFIVTVFTVLHTFLCLITAYPLSKKYLPGRNTMLLTVVLPMVFSGGIVPTYLVMRDLHLINTIHILILAGLFSGFNIVLMKNFLGQIPQTLEEAAKIDGAGDLRILFGIYMPLSLPIIASIALFSAVTKWNDYFTALMYVTKSELYPLQNVLRSMIIEGNVDVSGGGFTDSENLTLLISVKMAVIIIATVPIVCIYPFVQKHFVKGMLIGSVKG